MPFPIGQDNMPLDVLFKRMEEEDGAGGGGAGGGSNEEENTNQEPSWRDSLPDDIREDVNLTKFDSVEALAKSYMHASSMIGRDKIPMPKTDEEWAEVYNKLGRPESAEQYEIALEEGLHEDINENLKNSIPWFKEVAHSLGLSHKQASAFHTEYVNFVKKQMEENQVLVKEQMSETTQALKLEYGQAYNTKLHLANRAMDRFGGPGLVEKLAKSGLGRDPEVVKAFVQIGELISEDLGLDKNGEPTNTPAELQDQIEDLQSQGAYLDDTHPQHARVVKQVQALMERLYPAEPGNI